MPMQEIHSAAYDGDTNKVAELLDRGVDVNSIYDASAWTPLHIAVSRGQLECAALLLERGADIGARDEDGWTPLYMADSPDAVAFLVEHGADINAVDYSGFTPLGRALGKGAIDAALRQHGGQEQPTSGAPPRVPRSTPAIGQEMLVPKPQRRWWQRFGR